ncbi:MAG: 4Fe-4S binding protein [Methanomicrobiales archaeon]|nr:4Fe-4S binding protein [Methanomicrobiales archaeon]
MRFIINYLQLIIKKEWLQSFFNPKTAPLETPYHTRIVPEITGRACTHCYLCQMVCPAPGAIEVIKTGKPAVWNPKIYPGHCIRCGLCVEICPEIVLESGRIFRKITKSETWMDFTFHIQVNPVTCLGCGSCAVACPVNRQTDLVLTSKGTITSGDIILGVENGISHVFHEEKCTGCRTCEEHCPTQSIRVSRSLVMNQGYIYEDDDYEE